MFNRTRKPWRRLALAGDKPHNHHNFVLGSLTGCPYNSAQGWQSSLEGIPLFCQHDTFERNGHKYYKQGDYEKAAYCFSMSIDVNKRNPDPYYYHGLCYFQLFDFEIAAADFWQVIRLDPDCSDAYRLLGLCYHQLGDLGHAKQYLSEALLRLAPDALLYAARGDVLSDLHQFDEAVADYDKAIELDPTDAMLFANRASIYAQLGDYQLAGRDAERALQLNPEDAIAYSVRGHLLMEQGYYEEAVADYTAVLTLAPAAPGAYYNRGCCLYQLNSLDEALHDFQQATKECEPDFAYSPGERVDHLAWNYIGIINEAKGKNQRAVSAYRKSIESHPEYAQAYKNLGLLYRDLSKNAEALATLTRARELFLRDEDANEIPLLNALLDDLLGMT